MTKRDPARTEKLRIAVRYLLQHGELATGSQTRLAEHFKVSRQRVHQIVQEERRRTPPPDDPQRTTSHHESRAS